MVKITDVQHGSLADKKGIKSGDLLVSVNGNEIRDVLDYRFYLTENKVCLELMRDNQNTSVSIEKDEYEDIGLEFETPLMDKKHSCKNGCIFCFIDQNPAGLRESLYFKDDDSRLSFIHGNYVTLTNMSREDVDRIIKMRMSPINISVHTTNPELRVKMMKNKHSGEVLSYLNDFKDAGLAMCGQIVLCRGVNDGEELMRTLRDLSELYPSMSSVSVVPAGLTKYRDGLYPLSDFTAEEAGEVIDMIDRVAFEQLKRCGSRQFFAADEFYLKANRPIPKSDYYEDYPQIENGVGMIRSFVDELEYALEDMKEHMSDLKTGRRVTVATGAASFAMLSDAARRIEQLCPQISINVVKIVNNFFGESVTVSGLLTGKDICEQLAAKDLGDELLLPVNCLKADEDIFLCGMTLSELGERLGVEIGIVDNDGYAFCEAVIGC